MHCEKELPWFKFINIYIYIAFYTNGVIHNTCNLIIERFSTQNVLTPGNSSVQSVQLIVWPSLH